MCRNRDKRLVIIYNKKVKTFWRYISNDLSFSKYIYVIKLHIENCLSSPPRLLSR